MNKIVKIVGVSLATVAVVLTLGGVVAAQGPTNTGKGDGASGSNESQVFTCREESLGSLQFKNGSGPLATRNDARLCDNAMHETREWVTLTGVVLDDVQTDTELVVRTDAGGEITVGLGPIWYRSQILNLVSGDQVSLYGFWEDGEFKAGEIVVIRDGEQETIALRDDTGRPLWSGHQDNATLGSSMARRNRTSAQNRGHAPRSGRFEGYAKSGECPSDGSSPNANGSTRDSGRGNTR